MKVLSLFDGIGGARQALKELNIDCEYYSSEIDKYAMQISKANHDDIVHIGDVRDISRKNEFLFFTTEIRNGNQVFDNLNNTNLLIGGSPCQNLSIAGNGKGLKGKTSSLFYEYVRILKEVKPKYFVLENVNSMKKADKEAITKELWNIKPIMINSALVTAQQRKRLYWIGKLINGKYKKVNIPQPEDKGILLKDILDNGYTERDKSLVLPATYSFAVCRDYFLKSQRQLIFNKPVRIGEVSKGMSGRVYSVDGKSICLSANGGGRGAKTGLYEIKPYVRKLTVKECCRLQGFPDSYVSMVSKTQAYKALGNSFTVPVIKHILLTLTRSEK